MPNKAPPVIAIDGPAASGKGTLARKLAAHFGFAHLDSGALYRAVALTLLDRGADLGDEAAATKAAQTLDFAITARPEIRLDETGTAASRISAIPDVRTALLKFQRNFAENPPENAPGAVIDGRDIGTVVCPKAACKLFVTADDTARAQRRFDEMTAKGASVTYEEILADLKARDERDKNRATAPLSQAADAILLDTSELDIEGAFQRALDIVAARLRGLGYPVP